MWETSCILLHYNTAKVVISSDKWIKMVDCEHCNEMWKVNWHKLGQRFAEKCHFLCVMMNGAVTEEIPPWCKVFYRSDIDETYVNSTFISL